MLNFRRDFGLRRVKNERTFPESLPLSTDFGYIIYSSMGTFFIPLAGILLTYWKIFHVARKRQTKSMHRIVERAIFLSASQTAPRFAPNQSSLQNPKFPRLSVNLPLLRSPMTVARSPRAALRSPSQSQQETENSENEDSKIQFASYMQERIALIRSRERQAFLLLGSIILSFVICWAPFFTLYLLRGLSIVINGPLFEAAFFIGYCNSAVNPVLYALLNADFKTAVVNRLNCFPKFFSAVRQ